MRWTPNTTERRYVKLAMSMSADCLFGRGTVDVETYADNLRLIADQISTAESRPANEPSTG